MNITGVTTLFQKIWHFLLKVWKLATRLLAFLTLPIRKNGLMILVMSALWAICVWRQKQYDGDVWLHIQELAIDLYLLSVLLSLLPRRIARWVKSILYIFVYLITIFELFLTERFMMLYTPMTLRLWQETNMQETREFFSAYLFSGNALWKTLGMTLPILAAHVIINLLRRKKKPCMYFPPWINLIIVAFACWCTNAWWQEKEKMVTFFRQPTSQTAEIVKWQTFYTPFYRLVHSARMLQLANNDLVVLKRNMHNIQSVPCTHRCKQIVLVIGESYNKYHSQLYGYPHATTPKQMEMARQGDLVAMHNVVSVWNLTSNVFKHLFSTHSIDQEGGWYDGVLFPALMRKAGYKVAFLTNQFQNAKRQSGVDFNGSFFLNDPETDSLCFDFRNKIIYRFDKTFIQEYEQYQPGENNLIIFHLYGQHQKYDYRFTYRDRFFTPDSTKKHEGLKPWMRQMLADYDNATRYNDDVFSRICQYFHDEDAIVIYVADHGEEIFDHSLMFGRTPADPIVPIVAHYEFEVPMVMWFSPSFKTGHPDIVSSVRQAQDRPFMTDDLPHLVMGLAGIGGTWYDPKRDLLSDSFNIKRKRMLKGVCDFDSLMRHNRFERERAQTSHNLDSILNLQPYKPCLAP